MIQEYLLLNKDEINKVKKYQPEGITKTISTTRDGKCHYIRFYLVGESFETAKAMSKLDSYVQKTFNVAVLENGCSSYFNGRLYPLINRFEQNLRKLLYLVSSGEGKDSQNSSITEIERQDFGQIFSMLFIDESFIKKIKSEINNRNKDYFSKRDVLQAIQDASENTLWDSLLGKDVVPTLRERFIDVRLFRNDVMHSHYISLEKYNSILKLFQTINVEFEDAFQNILRQDRDDEDYDKVNRTLRVALSAQQLDEYSEMMSNLTAVYQEYAQKLTKAYITLTPLISEFSKTREIIEAFKDTITPSLQGVGAIESFFSSQKPDQPQNDSETIVEKEAGSQENDNTADSDEEELATSK